MEQITAVVLQVHPLPGRIGGDQDPQGIKRRWAVEAAFKRFALFIANAAVEGGDSLLLKVAAGDQAAQLLLQPALGVGVLREDQQALAIPAGAWLAQIGAEVAADPIAQVVDAGIGLVGSLAADCGHLIKQGPLTRPHRQRRCGHGQAVLLVGLFQHAFFIGVGPVVVAVDSLLQQAQLVRAAGAAQHLALLAAFEGVAVHTEGAPEGFHRTEQPLLQVGYHQQFGGPLLVVCHFEMLFPTRSVVLQQLRQLQLRCFGGQAIEHHRHHIALGQIHTNLAQVFLEAPHQHRLKIRLAHTHAAAEAGGIEDLQQRRKAVAVVVVGSGGKEEFVLEPPGQIPHRPGELGIDRHL